MLAEGFLKKQPGAKIIHDPRLTWNTIDIVHANNGVAIQSKTGHAFIKERMRAEDAVYSGEMSAHHYFRDFAYCDSGMIPWLLVAELLCTAGKTLGQLVNERIAAYPCSGEINFRVADVQASIENIEKCFNPPLSNSLPLIDTTDGLSMAFADWRFNLRGSNTEPVLRLNVESRGDVTLMQEKLALVTGLLSENVKPPIYPLTDIMTIQGKRIIAVSVRKGISRPYQTSKGVYFTKSGSDKRKMPPEELRRLFAESERLFADEEILLR